MPWACDRCRTVHTQNPDECRNCSHRVFDPIGPGEVERRSEGVESPDPVSVDRTQVMGTERDPDYESSPDVSLDGSVESGEANAELTSTAPQPTSPTVLHKLRATVVAPVLLLRQYLLPLLAFLVVFGGVAYLLGIVP